MNARQMILLIGLAFVLPSIALAANGPDSQRGHTCLSYEPAMVRISGRLERKTYPGRPNFKSIRNGDEPETGFYLSVSRPICTNADGSSADAYPQQNGVKLVQLVLDRAGYKKLRPMLSRIVTLKGSLFAAHTGHHHAPLLLNNVQLATSTTAAGEVFRYDEHKGE